MTTDGWPDEEFGQTWAAIYDHTFADLADDTVAATAMLVDLLGPGADLLELGVGTGRLAIPLAAAGLTVTGLDASQRMLDAMAAKPGGDAVAAVLGDMGAPPVVGPFDAVLIAFNTLFALPSQDRQVACVTAAADRLRPGGRLIVDAAVPQPWRFGSGQAYQGDTRADQIALEMADHDPVAQTVRAARVVVNDDDGTVRTLPLNMRYAWPSEIDLMARVAGLSRTQRWADWGVAPLQPDSTRHVSVYTKESP